MSLINIIGERGSGKTLYTTWYAITTGEDRPVYANYPIKHDNFKLLHPEDLKNLHRNSLVIIDEAFAWLNPYRTMTDINLYLTLILTQSRKRNLEIMVTAQQLRLIDKNFREMADYFITCRKSQDGFHYDIIKISSTEHYKPISKFLPLKNSKEIWSYYDTEKEVDYIGKNIDDLSLTDKNAIMPEVEAAAIELLKTHGPKYYKKGVLQDIAVEKGWGKQFVDMLYNKIQRLST